jgi:DNA-binding HxlR family transcriptional regulator
MEQAATMLRQQQAEIAELKHMNRNWQISENILLLELEKLQHRELTDREIYQTWVEAKNTALNTRSSDFVEVIFARAILRKAQEK